MNSAHLVIHPELLRSSAKQAVGVLKILANEDRLMLLCQLSQGEMCVSELEEALIRHLETFLLELGNEFAFVGRQKRLRNSAIREDESCLAS